MELKVYKDTVTAAESICDTKLELPVETEMLIPDYLPQVFKIVKCFVYLWCCKSRSRRAGSR